MRDLLNPYADVAPGQRQSRRAARGFTFTEVLFAVVILGIGFIMIAAMFPVAIQQTQATVEETAGATVAQGAVRMIEPVATHLNLPSTGLEVHPLPQAIWEQVRGDAISRRNPGHAWVALYRRMGAQQHAQVFVIAAQARESDAFTTADLLPGPGGRVTLQPRQVDVDYLPGTPARVDISGTHASAVAEGAFLLMASGPGAGHVLRIGQHISGGRWELLPGADGAQTILLDDSGTRRAYILGRGLDGGGNYAGLAQDIAFYTTFIQLR